MMKREMYICIRFSKKVQEKAGQEGLEILKKRFETEFVPRLKAELDKVDKKAKVWMKIV
jgi:hypothetical protein